MPVLGNTGGRGRCRRRVGGRACPLRGYEAGSYCGELAALVMEGAVGREGWATVVPVLGNTGAGVGAEGGWEGELAVGGLKQAATVVELAALVRSRDHWGMEGERGGAVC